MKPHVHTRAQRPDAPALPLLTADLPGTGGTVRKSPEDFRVVEVPAYEPRDEGEHCYLRVLKRGLTTHEVMAALKQCFRVPESAIGVAGLKDKHALTEQTISVQGIRPESAAEFRMEGVRVLWARMHTNMLRRGHLAGNRFEIRVRSCKNPRAARPVLEAIARRGLPNYFGEQRFGKGIPTDEIGEAIVRRQWARVVALVLDDVLEEGWEKGDRDAARREVEAALRARKALWNPVLTCARAVAAALVQRKMDAHQAVTRMPLRFGRLYLYAFQSRLFNEVLARRIGSLDKLLEGDLACVQGDEKCFRVEDPAAEQARADALEVSPTGPIFGKRMKRPGGEPGRMEEEVLASRGLKLNEIRPGPFRMRLKGSRRALRVPVGELDSAVEGHDLLLRFFLPSGSYATCLLDEVMKA